MKRITDIIQSQKLAGIMPKGTHDAVWEYDSLACEHNERLTDHCGSMDYPAWSLSALLQFLRTKVNVSLISVEERWTAIARGEAAATRQEPLDAVVDLIKRLNEKGVI